MMKNEIQVNSFKKAGEYCTLACDADYLLPISKCNENAAVIHDTHTSGSAYMGTLQLFKVNISKAVKPGAPQPLD